ncbi:uncharacterized protein IUM83_06307 [Phytophthora cinnamomi]|uniref:uncharacterized protein n=1 Tax=Phytophthora cinnamomi TaxID=4785 RepID=UPI003559D79D|nr:hypothetical protein IUM83_06307 [Phytophthora cinnamomi]
MKLQRPSVEIVRDGDAVGNGDDAVAIHAVAVPLRWQFQRCSDSQVSPISRVCATCCDAECGRSTRGGQEHLTRQ